MPNHLEHQPSLARTVTLAELEERIAVQREEVIRLEALTQTSRKALGEMEAVRRFLFGEAQEAASTARSEEPETQSSDEGPVASIRKVSLAKTPEPKIKHLDQVLAVMSESPEEWRRAIDIIDRAVALFPKQKRIERTSISPLLTKMREAKLVEHQAKERRWRIAAAGLTQVAASGIVK